MEPERDMEQTLAAYARQRRAEAGEPPALSPANRAQLQRAVAGMAGVPASPSPVHPPAPLPWWVRWGLPFGLVAAVGAFALVVLPHWAWWTDERMMTEAALASGPTSAAAGARAGQSAPPPTTVSLPPPGMTLAGRAAAAPTPAPAVGLGGQGVAASAPPMAPAPVAALAAASPAAGMADRAMPKRGAAPAVPLVSEGFLAPGLPKDLAVQAFAGTPLVQGSPVEGVLKAFRIEMQGGEVRLIDADGSVYSGSIGRSDAYLPGQGVVGGAARPPGTGPSAARPGRPLYLRVEGGNRTRGQVVRFSGALVPSTPAGVGFLAGFKLEGRLRVGEAPDVGFEAAPAR